MNKKKILNNKSILLIISIIILLVALSFVVFGLNSLKTSGKTTGNIDYTTDANTDKEIQEKDQKASGSDKMPSYDKSVTPFKITHDNNVKVSWYLVGKGLTKQVYEFSVKNKEDQDLDFLFSVFMENVNYDPSKHIDSIKVYELQKVAHQFTIDNPIRQCPDLLTNGSNNPLTCIIQHNYTTVTNFNNEWIEISGNDIISNNGVRKELGLKHINKQNTNDIGTVSKNNKNFYRIEFNTPILKNNEGFGSFGVFGIYINEYKHYQYWNHSWSRQYNLQITNPDSIAHTNELIAVNLSANNVICGKDDNSDALVVINKSDDLWQEIHSDLDSYNGTLLFAVNISGNDAITNDYHIFCDNPSASTPSYRPLVYVWDNFNYTGIFDGKESWSPLIWTPVPTCKFTNRKCGMEKILNIDMGKGKHNYATWSGDAGEPIDIYFVDRINQTMQSRSNHIYMYIRTMQDRKPSSIWYAVGDQKQIDKEGYQIAIFWSLNPHPYIGGEIGNGDNVELYSYWTANETRISYFHIKSNQGTEMGIVENEDGSQHIYDESTSVWIPDTFTIVDSDPLIYGINSTHNKIDNIIAAKEPMRIYRTSSIFGIINYNIDEFIDTIGVYRPNTSTFFLRNSNSEGNPDIIVTFGVNGDIPIVGDWDGDGIDTIGIYRPRISRFWIMNSNDGGPWDPSKGDASFPFGWNLREDIPLVGDWNGDGNDEIGVYRKKDINNNSISKFIISTDYVAGRTTPPNVNLQFNFGAPGDIPLVGDWNGDGVDTIGVYRPTISTFFLRNSNSEGNPDIIVTFGVNGDIPIVGDWDGNEKTELGVKRGTSWFIDYDGNGIWDSINDKTFIYGRALDKPVTGKWIISF